MVVQAIASLIVLASGSPGYPATPDLSQQAAALEAEGKFGEAAVLWDRLKDENPVFPDYPLNGATDWYGAKEYGKAISDYKLALTLGATVRANISYNLGCCYALAGDKKNAMYWVTEAFNIGFRDLKQMAKDSDLTLLHNDRKFREMASLVDASKMTRDSGYRYDLWLLNRELRRLHYSPYRIHSKQELDGFVARTNEDIPHLTDNEIGIRFKQLAVMMGDGHTQVKFKGELSDDHDYAPLFFYKFKEGLYITSSTPEYSSLLGNQVLAVNGHSVEELERTFRPIISKDNEQCVLARFPEMLRCGVLLNGLGITPDTNSLMLKVQDSAGKIAETRVNLNAGKEPGPDITRFQEHLPGPTLLTNLHRDRNFWFEYQPLTKTVYFQYNRVHDEDKKTIESFAKELFSFVESHDVDRMIMDMRWNGGGNNFLNKPLLEGLIKSKVNLPGKLFVIISRHTYSAAICGATQIERYTNAIFVGEPLGSPPNFIGESVEIQLPYGKVFGSVSDLYWQNSNALDQRIWVAPQIYVPPTFADFAAKRDAMLEAAMSYKGN